MLKWIQLIVFAGGTIAATIFGGLEGLGSAALIIVAYFAAKFVVLLKLPQILERFGVLVKCPEGFLARVVRGGQIVGYIIGKKGWLIEQDTGKIREAAAGDVIPFGLPSWLKGRVPDEYYYIGWEGLRGTMGLGPLIGRLFRSIEDKAHATQTVKERAFKEVLIKMTYFPIAMSQPVAVNNAELKDGRKVDAWFRADVTMNNAKIALDSMRTDVTPQGIIGGTYSLLTAMLNGWLASILQGYVYKRENTGDPNNKKPEPSLTTAAALDPELIGEKTQFLKDFVSFMKGAVHGLGFDLTEGSDFEYETVGQGAVESMYEALAQQKVDTEKEIVRETGENTKKVMAQERETKIAQEKEKTNLAKAAANRAALTAIEALAPSADVRAVLALAMNGQLSEDTIATIVGGWSLRDSNITMIGGSSLLGTLISGINDDAKEKKSKKIVTP